MTVEARLQSIVRRSEFEATMLPLLDGVFRLTMWLVRDRGSYRRHRPGDVCASAAFVPSVSAGDNPRAWLLSIMRHVRANRYRAARRAAVQQGMDDVFEHIPAMEETPRHTSQEAEVLEALRELPAGFQEVVLLCDVEELSYREIADVLGAFQSGR